MSATESLLIGRSLPRVYITPCVQKWRCSHAIGTLLYIVRSDRPLVSVIRRSLAESRGSPRSLSRVGRSLRWPEVVIGTDWIAPTFAPRTWPLTYYRLPVVYVYARDQSRIEARANERECIGVARIIAKSFTKGREISCKFASIFIQCPDTYSRCTRINKNRVRRSL